MKLRERAPKIGPTREVSTASTLERVTPLLRTVGVTRVADLTGLDRTGIPVYSAVVPRSHDIMSVYNGKGRTHEDARTSAIMEAVERFSAWQPLAPDRIGSYAELAASGLPVLDPAEHTIALSPHYRPDRPMSWKRGFDLLADEEVYIPLCLAGYYVSFHEKQCFAINTSNGLASGNTLEEAVCHALCEVIERDALTLADVVSNRLAHMVRDKFGSSVPARVIARLEDRHPSVDPGKLPEAAGWYADRIESTGVRLAIRHITSSTGIPSFAVMVAEDLADTFSSGHAGYGTHPDAEVALIRALTETAQSRVVDIQGMREDISLPSDQVANWHRHVARGGDIDFSVWPWRESVAPVSFADLPSHPSDDVVSDIALMLDRLRGEGLDRVIVVDRTPPGFPVHVVRVIVPGLESWAIDQSRLGRRASAEWDRALASISSKSVPSKSVPSKRSGG
ncbi:YcaO-like family protein [Nonomuraea sp. K274]|uniref:YcaO-like family protein n=1 Tax=Nonomuraea cypriaca TaxID=1187855 RepID=A0A931ADL9_9ACTN|nr:YcaO-like family protein [Nonomuraea cypriaca]MBF8191022.1 YcaO-like family protein [Nonomuraea cypriaca]